MNTQLSLNSVSGFISIKDLSAEINSIEKVWDVKFEPSLKTFKAKEEAESLSAKAEKIRASGDIDFFLEVVGIIRDLKNASIYHAYKSAAFAYIKEAQTFFESLNVSDIQIASKLADAKKELKHAPEQPALDISIGSFIKSMMLSRQVIEKCKSVVVNNISAKH